MAQFSLLNGADDSTGRPEPVPGQQPLGLKEPLGPNMDYYKAEWFVLVGSPRDPMAARIGAAGVVGSWDLQGPYGLRLSGILGAYLPRPPSGCRGAESRILMLLSGCRVSDARFRMPVSNSKNRRQLLATGRHLLAGTWVPRLWTNGCVVILRQCLEDPVTGDPSVFFGDYVGLFRGSSVQDPDSVGLTLRPSPKQSMPHRRAMWRLKVAIATIMFCLSAWGPGVSSCVCVWGQLGVSKT